MIMSFKHRGLEKFYKTGSKAGIQPAHAKKLELQLGFLNAAVSPNAMAVPGWDLHILKGELAGHLSVKVNGNWRLTFRFIGVDAEIVDYQDYH
jgi:proteic killer suppression protein